jgi:hypothetical protein
MYIMAKILTVLPEISSAFYIKKEDGYPPPNNIWSIRSSGKTKQEFLDYLDSRMDKWRYLGLRPEAVNTGILTGKSKGVVEYTAFIKLPLGVNLGSALPEAKAWFEPHPQRSVSLRVTK